MPEFWQIRVRAKSLTNMKIVITGASRGIGKELLNHYQKKNEEVYGLSSKDCDLVHWDQTSCFFEQSNFNDIDLTIHCAASNVTRFFHKMSSDTFKNMIDTNILGTFNLLKCVIPRLKQHGCVILFSSASAFSPRMGQAAYACCKSALHGLVKVLVQEMLAEEKYIFLIAPGMVETGMPMKMMSETALEKARNSIPMKRFCKIDEIISAIDFLQQTPYMTGQTIHVNGSYYVQ